MTDQQPQRRPFRVVGEPPNKSELDHAWELWLEMERLHRRSLIGACVLGICLGCLVLLTGYALGVWL